MSITRIALSVLTSFVILCGAASAQDAGAAQQQSSTVAVVTAAGSASGVRFVAPGEARRIRLEVYSAAGERVFDSDFRAGGILDWDGAGLADGSYLCVVTVEDLQGKAARRLSAVAVQSGRAALQKGDEESLKARYAQALASSGQASGDAAAASKKAQAVTVTAHDGRDGQVTSTTGALTFRTGDVFAGRDREQMRITPEGQVGIGTDNPTATLDVAGTIRARGGIQFDDGTVLNSASVAGVKTAVVAATASSGGVTANATGAGTSGRLAKWTDNAGTLGDSAISEVGGRIGIGTASPDSKVTIRGDSTVNTAIPGFKLENSGDPLGRNVRVQNYYPGITYFAANTYRDAATGNWFLDNKSRGSAGMLLSTEEWLPGLGNYLQLWAAPNGVTTGSSNLIIWDNSKVSINKPIGLATQSAAGLLDIGGKGSTSSTASLAVSNSNSASLLFVRDDGNVGVGTASPAQRLEVAGNVKISGNGNGLMFPDGSVQTTAATGGGQMTGSAIVSAINDPATAGLIGDNRLSPNVARLSAQNAWTGQNTFVNGLSANGTNIVNVANPVSATDAANKAYVDGGFVKFVPGAEQLSVGDANGTAAMINLRGGSTCCSGPGGHTPAWFKVFQNGSFVATGNLGIGVSPMQGKGYRTSWDSYKGAFRSGYADAEWDDANVGFFSWAGGSNSTAVGLYSLAFGDTNSAESTSSIVFGSGNQVKGAAGFSAGAGNRVCDTYGVALGNNAKSGGPYINGRCDPDSFNIRGLAAIAMGYNVTADQDHTIAMGKFASNNGFTGTFIWSDGSATASADTFRNTANNEFAARATGGFRFRTNLAGTTGCNLPAGSGVFNCTSSRTTKENFSLVDGDDVLARLRKVPVSTWNYISEGRAARHLGPMAEDFYSAFRLGVGNTSIGVQDAVGVSLAAVKALDARTLELQQKTEEVEQLRAKVNSLEQRLAALEQLIRQNAKQPGADQK